jgi:hypothetical protein
MPSTAVEAHFGYPGRLSGSSDTSVGRLASHYVSSAQVQPLWTRPGETVGSLSGLSYLPNRNQSFMDKFPDIFLWVVLPLLLILPTAVYAETVRCATELSRICDPSQACTSNTTILPAIEYFIELRNEQGTATIAKKVGGKKMASWKADFASDADSMGQAYSMQTGPDNTFNLSRSLNTFSFRFPVQIGIVRWERHELGTCSLEAP